MRRGKRCLQESVGKMRRCVTPQKPDVEEGSRLRKRSARGFPKCRSGGRRSEVPKLGTPTGVSEGSAAWVFFGLVWSVGTSPPWASAIALVSLPADRVPLRPKCTFGA